MFVTIFKCAKNNKDRHACKMSHCSSNYGGKKAKFLLLEQALNSLLHEQSSEYELACVNFSVRVFELLTSVPFKILSGCKTENLITLA